MREIKFNHKLCASCWFIYIFHWKLTWSFLCLYVRSVKMNGLANIEKLIYVIITNLKAYSQFFNVENICCRVLSAWIICKLHFCSAESVYHLSWNTCVYFLPIYFLLSPVQAYFYFLKRFCQVCLWKWVVCMNL